LGYRGDVASYREPGDKNGPVLVFRQHAVIRRLWWLLPVASLGLVALFRSPQVQSEVRADPLAPALFDMTRWPSTLFVFAMGAFICARWALQTVTIDDSGVTIHSFWTARIPWSRVMAIHRVHHRVFLKCTDGTWFLPLAMGKRSQVGAAYDASIERWLAVRGEPWEPPKVERLMVDRDRHGHAVLRDVLRLRADQLPYVTYWVAFVGAFQRDLTYAFGYLLFLGALVAFASRRRVVVTEHHVNVLGWPRSERIPRSSVIAVSERPSGMGRQIVLETTTGVVPLPFAIPSDGWGRKTEYYRQWTWLHDELVVNRRYQRHVPRGPRPEPVAH
jgi:hypothetical protein